MLPQGGLKLRGVQTAGRPEDGRAVPALAAEGQDLRPHLLQEGHCAVGKMLRRGGGPYRGQLQHQVRASHQGHSGPAPLVGDGAVPPLDKVAAHDGNHRAVPHPAAGLGDMMAMAAMEGIIFRHNAHNFHRLSASRNFFRKIPKNPLFFSNKRSKMSLYVLF